MSPFRDGILSIATSLAQGFQVPFPTSFDEGTKTYRNSSGGHIGKELFDKILGNPKLLDSLIVHCQGCLEKGRSKLSELNSAHKESFRDQLDIWRELLETLYQGALDEVTPFEEAMELVMQLSGIPENSMERWHLLSPCDGKNLLWYREHAVLLHLAFVFRRAPSAFFSSSYDSFDRDWLDSNFIPLGQKDGFDCEDDPVEPVIHAQLGSLEISNEDYQLAASRSNKIESDELESAFLKVRDALKDLNWTKGVNMKFWSNARDVIVQTTPEPHREQVLVIINLIGHAMQFNEQIHQLMCHAANALRRSAKEKELPFVPLHLAWESVSS